jgi:uncharacterized protein YydD (DUF2326 family)
MITKIWSDSSGFKEVNLTPGFNVILADKSKSSGSKDSRNGLGKSSLIEIVHFLLGSSAAGFKLKKSPLVANWTYFADMTVRGIRFVVGRSAFKASRILLEHCSDNASIESLVKQDGNVRYIERADWVNYLGNHVFDNQVGNEKYSATFRSLIAYFIRRGPAAYNSPFETYQKQPAWEIQVDNAYLLGLDWTDARTFQELRDRKSLIDNLKHASDVGIVTDFLGVRGELEAKRNRLENELRKSEHELASFAVPQQYEAIEIEADDLTTAINDLSNANYASRQMLNDYRESLEQQMATDYIDVETLYAEVGAIFQPTYLRTLKEARDFHERLIQNRRDFLTLEMRQLERTIAARESDIAVLNVRRAESLRLLAANGALDQFTLLNNRLRELEEGLVIVRERLAKINELESASAQLTIDKAVAQTDALAHYNERSPARDSAGRLFNEASKALYETPGDLLINIGKEGFTFGYNIERKDSKGVTNAAIFCYDITLAELWSGRSGMNTLWHDSMLFDPIEERQVAKALEYAAGKSRDLKFQYVCLLNSDRVPEKHFSSDFDLDSYTVLTLTDRTESDGLLGLRF